MSRFIECHKEKHVWQMVLNRPEKKNALVHDMYTDMQQIIQHSDDDEDCRVLLIRSNGDSFCAGNDLKDFVEHMPTSMDAPVFQFMQALVNAKKPLVAAVQGAAVGIGTTMLLHCDLVFASDSVKFQLPFVNLGVCAEAGSSLLLPQMCGHQQTAELMLTGDPFNAEKAQQIGLVNRIVAESELTNLALEQAQILANKPPAALQATRRLLKQANTEQLQSQIKDESLKFIELLKAEEAQNIIQAFLNR